MNFRTITTLSFIVISCFCSFFSLQAQAIEPKFKIELVTPGANKQLIPTGTAGPLIISYRITNMTTLGRVLHVAPINQAFAGWSCADSCGANFTLNPGESCDLCMTMYTDWMAAGESIVGGPIVCKQGAENYSVDPLFCSQPSANETLNIQITE